MIARSIRFGGTGKSSIRRLAAYLISHQGNEERVLAWRITNCLEDIGRETGFEEDDVRLAAAAMQLTQQANTRARGDKTYHLVVSFRERPNAAQLRHVEDELFFFFLRILQIATLSSSAFLSGFPQLRSLCRTISKPVIYPVSVLFPL